MDTRVKNLAAQTAKATEDISREIARNQGATREAVEAISAITGTIERVSAISKTMAVAIEEQNEATGEIVRSIQATARAAQDVSTNISGLSSGSAQTGQSADHLFDSAADLSKQAERVASEVRDFLFSVRAA